MSRVTQNYEQFSHIMNVNFGIGDQFIEIIPKYLLVKDCLVF
jgi:hypothetical protein